ncbi:MAG TPA: hypothetical protein VFP96_13050 [Candidatus Acidoferrum sp.]|nr:hypothetical protein [Candidatus Acidoferrum sp.]
MNKVALLMLTWLVVSCTSRREEVTGVGGPPSPEELKTAIARLRLVRSDMPPSLVLDTLALSRFRDCAKEVGGPKDRGVSFDLGGDHTLDLYYQRQSTNSSLQLYWVYLDEAGWYPAEERRDDASNSAADVRKQGQPISPVTVKELASAKEGLRLLRPNMTVNQVLTTLMLSRFRGHSSVGSGSISLSIHHDLGNGHKLDMIYDRKERPTRPWDLSWVGLDWQDNQTGLGQWKPADRNKK